MNELFHKIAVRVATTSGSPAAFLIASGTILIWATTGPIFHYSNTWQLVINTGTTIVTFLMVFLIQNTQNRDSKALHLKLDELIRANRSARNLLMDVEELEDVELETLHLEFKRLHDESYREIARRKREDKPSR